MNFNEMHAKILLILIDEYIQLALSGLSEIGLHINISALDSSPLLSPSDRKTKVLPSNLVK